MNNNTHIARHWGFKAAQSGLPATSNPYSNPLARAAWDAGHRQVTMDNELIRGRHAIAAQA